MGSWIENSSERGDMTKFICTQRLSKHGFARASIKWLQKIYLNSVHHNVDACQRACVDRNCIISTQWGVWWGRTFSGPPYPENSIKSLLTISHCRDTTLEVHKAEGPNSPGVTWVNEWTYRCSVQIPSDPFYISRHSFSGFWCLCF